MSIRAVTYFVILAIVLLVDTQRPHAKTFNERASVCLGCHGEKGQSKTPETPSLGGQPAPYLLIQLYLFREKQRVSEPMNDIDFSDDDLRLFSDNLSKLPPPLPPSSAPDAARMTAAARSSPSIAATIVTISICPAATTFRASPISARTTY